MAEGQKSPKANTGPAGHRARLRQRFLSGGPSALADYELLELLLFQAIPRRDVKPLAKELIAAFGSLAAVLSAEREALSQHGLSDTVIAVLKSVTAAAHVLTRAGIETRPIFENWDAVLDHLRLELAHRQREHFRVLYLDRQNRLIADELLSEGTVDRAAVYPREVAARALALSATAVVLAHNHPSGDPAPSDADIAMTRDLNDTLVKLGISLHDHIVVGKTGHASLKALGLF